MGRPRDPGKCRYCRREGLCIYARGLCGRCYAIPKVRERTPLIRKPILNRGDCLHCKKFRPIYSRGLCGMCYREPAIRPHYPAKFIRRDWRHSELRLLRQLRDGGLPQKQWVKFFPGRTLEHIRNATRQYRIIRFEKDWAGKIRRFRLLTKNGDRGTCDVARLTGWSRSTVWRLTRATGIKLPDMRTRKRVRPKERKPDNFMQCFACPAFVNGYKGIKNGWMTRPLPGRTNNSEREIYCPKCFARWGWPPVFSAEKRT